MLRLKLGRLMKDLSQRQVADLAGIFRSELSRFETGRANPTPDELKRLGRVLGCPVERLLDHVDESLFLTAGAEFRAEAREEA